MPRTHNLLFFVVLTAVAASAAGQEAKYTAPRTENGRPDLQGVWNFNSGVPFQRPAAFADKKFFTKEEFAKQHAAIRNGLAAVARFAPVENVGLDWLDDTLYVDDLRTSLITYPANGRLPALVDGVRRTPRVEEFIATLADAKGGPPPAFASLIAAFSGGRKDSYQDFNMSERCLFGVDVPFVPQLADNYVKIIQASDHVVLVTDFDRRVVSLDGRSPLGDTLRSWSGTSRGRWEGETLVIETRNFNDRMPSFGGAGKSSDKVVTERITRISRDVIEYAATVVDPKTFKDRVELSFPMARVDARIYEGSCHEGNYSLPNTLSAARTEDEARKIQ